MLCLRKRCHGVSLLMGEGPRGWLRPGAGRAREAGMLRGSLYRHSWGLKNECCLNEGNE